MQVAWSAALPCILFLHGLVYAFVTRSLEQPSCSGQCGVFRTFRCSRTAEL